MSRGKTFRVRIKGAEVTGDVSAVSGCVQLLGEPVKNKRAIFRQPGESRQKVRSDEDGCFSFQVVPNKGFTVFLKGPEVQAYGEGSLALDRFAL